MIMAINTSLKPNVLSKQAWDFICSWRCRYLRVDNTLIEIQYSKRDNSEVRIKTSIVDDIFDTIGTTETYYLSKEDIGVAILPENLSKLFRDVWNKKELERCQNDLQYFINKYTYIIGVDPYKK
jgi:hypothetical protein